jgi:hypothetical protein
MIKVNEKEIHMRLKNKYIKAIILSDDTLIINMNCELGSKMNKDLENIDINIQIL